MKSQESVPTTTKEPDVQIALLELSKSIDTLESSINDLTQRLAPVSCSRKDDECMAKEGTQSDCEMSGRLRELTTQVIRLVETVKEQHSTLEI